MSARRPSGRLYEFDGTNLIPEPAADVSQSAQPAALADRRSDAEPQLRLPALGHVPERVEADDHASSPQSLDDGGNYQIFGTQFNGLSNANAFGDEFQVDGNFPMVRITNNATGDVRYALTYNWTYGRGDRLRHRFNLVPRPHRCRAGRQHARGGRERHPIQAGERHHPHANGGRPSKLSLPRDAASPRSGGAARFVASILADLVGLAAPDVSCLSSRSGHRAPA